MGAAEVKKNIQKQLNNICAQISLLEIRMQIRQQFFIGKKYLVHSLKSLKKKLGHKIDTKDPNLIHSTSCLWKQKCTPVFWFWFFFGSPGTDHGLVLLLLRRTFQSSHPCSHSPTYAGIPPARGRSLQACPGWSSHRRRTCTAKTSKLAKDWVKTGRKPKSPKQ